MTEKPSLIFGCSIEKVMKVIKGQKCPLCYNQTFSFRSKLQNHIVSVHFKHRFPLKINKQPACVLPCRKDCFNRRSSFESNRSHFHCPFCEKTFGRCQSFKAHLAGKCQHQKSTGSSIKREPMILCVHKNLYSKCKICVDVAESCQNISNGNKIQRFMVIKGNETENKVVPYMKAQKEISTDPTSFEILNNSSTSHSDDSTKSLKLERPRKKRRKEEDSTDSCEVQIKILQVLEDLLQVEKQRLEVEKQKLHLSKLQATHDFLQT